MSVEEGAGPIADGGAAAGIEGGDEGARGGPKSGPPEDDRKGGNNGGDGNDRDRGHWDTTSRKVVVRNVLKFVRHKEVGKLVASWLEGREGIRIVATKKPPRDTWVKVTLEDESMVEPFIELINKGGENGGAMVNGRGKPLVAHRADAMFDGRGGDGRGGDRKRRGPDDGADGERGNGKKMRRSDGRPPIRILSTDEVRDAVTPLWRDSYETQLETKAKEMTMKCAAKIVKEIRGKFRILEKEAKRGQRKGCIKPYEWMQKKNAIRVEPPVPSPFKYEYRNKCEFTVGYRLVAGGAGGQGAGGEGGSDGDGKVDAEGAEGVGAKDGEMEEGGDKAGKTTDESNDRDGGKSKDVDMKDGESEIKVEETDGEATSGGAKDEEMKEEETKVKAEETTHVTVTNEVNDTEMDEKETKVKDEETTDEAIIEAAKNGEMKQGETKVKVGEGTDEVITEAVEDEEMKEVETKAEAKQTNGEVNAKTASGDETKERETDEADASAANATAEETDGAKAKDEDPKEGGVNAKETTNGSSTDGNGKAKDADTKERESNADVRGATDKANAGAAKGEEMKEGETEVMKEVETKVKAEETNFAKVPAAGFLAQGWHGGVYPPHPLQNMPDWSCGVCDVFNEFLRDSPMPPYDTRVHRGVWRTVTVRASLRTRECMVIVQHAPAKGGVGALEDGSDDYSGVFEGERDRLVGMLTGDAIPTPRRDYPESHDVGEAKRGCEGLSVTSVFFQEFAGISHPGPEHPVQHVFGKTSIEEKLGKCTFQISPGAFFQTNTEGAEVLYNIVVDRIKEVTTNPEKTLLLDVCCGTGTIGLTCLKEGVVGKLIGVDISEPAIKDAEINATKNGYADEAATEFIASPAEKVLGERMRDLPCDSPVVAVVDPARDGLHPAVIKALRAHERVGRLVYVSCNPTATLTRDAGMLCSPPTKKFRGRPFRPTVSQPVDMFPLTKHCEMVMTFDRMSKEEYEKSTTA